MADSGYAVSRIVTVHQREVSAAARLAVGIAEYLSEHGPMLKTVLRDRLCIASADRFDRAIRLAQVRVAGSKDGARLMVGKM